MIKNISKTVLELYLNCPRAWYYYKHPDIPKKTDYPRLCGVAVHNHVKQLYDSTRTPRPFFYQSKKSAIGAWFNRWNRELEKAYKSSIIVRDDELAKEYGAVGAVCIANYWNANVGLPRPVEVEKQYQMVFKNGFVLKGIFDQVRIVPLEWTALHRPDLVINGELKAGYAPVVIVDIKTDIYSYERKSDKEKNITSIQKAKRQFSLHEDLQATFYIYLYEKIIGKKPIGFLWYHLRSGKMFFTYRNDKDYQTLFGAINHYIEGIAGESFPKHVTKKCYYCDYIEVCREDRDFLVSTAEDFSEYAENQEIVPNLVQKEPHKQLRLKLKMERKKSHTPTLIVPEKIEQRIITLPDLPWDENT